MSAFTTLGVLVYLYWCFCAGLALGLALDVIAPLWLSRKLDGHIDALIATMTAKGQA